MLLFDIGANRGDATFAGLQKGYKGAKKMIALAVKDKKAEK
jgi:hypothetical protein